jgi:uroporphyrinogen-III decarboxylase
MITPRENLLAALNHKMPEWVPIVGSVSSFNVPVGMQEEFQSNFNIVAFSRYFGLDILERYDEARYEKMGEVRRYELPLTREIYHNVVVQTRREGDRIYRNWETPFGNLQATFQMVSYEFGDAPGVGTEFPVEYPIKGPQDFKAFASIFEDMEYEKVAEGVAALERRIAEIANEGITTLAAPSTPLGMSVRYYMGPETLAYAYSDDRTALEELLEIIGENYLKRQRLLADTNADGTISFDDTTTRAISPTMFRELELRYVNRAAAINHARGKLYIHHSCGHINGLLDLYAQSDMDAVDILTVKPLGDCTIADAKRRLGPRIAMIPAFETLTLNHGSLDEIRSMVKNFFEEARPCNNFVPVLYPLPNTSTLERLQVVVDEARKWQHRVG